MVTLVFSHETSAYYHEYFDIKDQGAWMGKLPNSTLLRDMSLPGTHETMARFGGDIPTCQTLSLNQLLRAGVRVFDIRCRCINQRWSIYHGPVYQFSSFDGVLWTVIDYLEFNPTETVLMRVKEEYEAENCQGDFKTQFELIYWTHQDYSEYFWHPGTDNPTLGEVRKKIIVLYNFSTDKNYGLSYPRFADIQDDYTMDTNYDLYKKWNAVKNQLIKANSNETRDTFYMNYLSASGGSFPYFVASGHSDSRTDGTRLWTGLTTIFGLNKNIYPDFPRILFGIYFEGTNILAFEWIKNNQPCFVGIVMVDFIGDGLIEQIILRNTHCSKNNQTSSLQT